MCEHLNLKYIRDEQGRPEAILCLDCQKIITDLLEQVESDGSVEEHDRETAA